jgi:hypothetical protein
VGERSGRPSSPRSSANSASPWRISSASDNVRLRVGAGPVEPEQGVSHAGHCTGDRVTGAAAPAQGAHPPPTASWPALIRSPTATLSRPGSRRPGADAPWTPGGVATPLGLSRPGDPVAEPLPRHTSKPLADVRPLLVHSSSSAPLQIGGQPPAVDFALGPEQQCRSPPPTSTRVPGESR